MRKRKGKRERKRERGSWRHGRIEMASWIRLFCAEIRKIPIANNIHQSVREHRLLSEREEKDECGQRWNFGGSRIAKLPMPEHHACAHAPSLSFFLLLLFYRPLSIVHFHPRVFHPQPLFSTEMDMFSSSQTPPVRSYSALGRANETTRYYYATADPCKQ